MSPVTGVRGGVGLGVTGKVWPEAKVTRPPNVVVPSAFSVPLTMPEAAFLRLVT